MSPQVEGGVDEELSDPSWLVRQLQLYVRNTVRLVEQAYALINYITLTLPSKLSFRHVLLSS